MGFLSSASISNNYRWAADIFAPLGRSAKLDLPVNVVRYGRVVNEARMESAP